MFERYTERARRVLFFARYEASQLGRISLDWHLPLGLIGKVKGDERIFARSHLFSETSARNSKAVRVSREGSRRRDPVSAETTRVLQVAAEERSLLNTNRTDICCSGPPQSAGAASSHGKGMRIPRSARLVQLLMIRPRDRVRKRRCRESAAT